MGATLPPPQLCRRVRGVLFDMCNVLYDDTVWRRWVLQLLSRIGLHTNYYLFFQVWQRDYLGEVYRGRITFGEAFRTYLRAVGLSAGQIDEVEAASEARRRQIEATARPLPGVPPTLARLKQLGLTLGAICNSEHPAAVLRDHLRRLDLDQLFAAVVSSADSGQIMPERQAYCTALSQMDLPAQSVAFVDHDAAELAGAAAVGMATIAFNPDPDAKADLYLTRFDDLIDVVLKEEPFAAAG